MIKRTVIYITYFLISLLIIAGFLIGLLQTDWGKDGAKNYLTDYLQKKLNPKLHIEKLDGNWLTHLSIYHLSIIETDSTVFSLDEIRIQFDLFDNIWQPIQLKSLTIYRPHFSLIQGRDGSFNFERWMIPTENQPDSIESKPLAITIKQISLIAGKINTQTQLPLLESSQFENIDISATLKLDQSWSLNLKHLSFTLNEPSLKEAIALEASAKKDDQLFTLESLLISTSRSVIESKGSIVGLDSLEQWQTVTQVLPLSWKDILAFSSDYPIEEDIKASVSVSGEKDSWNLGLGLSSSSMDSLSITIKGNQFLNPVISTIELAVREFNAAKMLGLDQRLYIESFSSQLSGNLYSAGIDSSTVTLTANSSGISYSDYSIKTVDLYTILNAGSAQATLHISDYSRSDFQVTATIHNLFSSEPDWVLNSRISNLNVAYWIQNANNGLINGEFQLNGHTFDPTRSIALSSTLSQSTVDLFNIDTLTLNGKIINNLADLSIDGTINGAKLSSNYRVSLNPLFSDITAQGHVSNIDMRRFTDNSTLRSNMTLHFEGNGDFSLGRNSYFSSTITVDSSLFSNSKIEEITAQTTYRNNSLTVDNFKLVSEIAHANGDAFLHLNDLRHKENRLSFFADIKEVKRLAPIIGADLFSLKGGVSGDISIDPDGLLNLNGRLDLENIRVDSLYTKGIRGSISAILMDTILTQAKLQVVDPHIGSLAFQTIELLGSARFKSLDHIQGNYAFSTKIKDKTGLELKGGYELRPDNQILDLSQILFNSSRRSFQLKESTRITIQWPVVTMDTLQLNSADNAFVKLHYSQNDTTYRLYTDISEIDAGAAYSTFFKDVKWTSYVGGYLDIEVSNNIPALTSDITLSNTNYNGFSFDKINLKSDYNNSQLNTLLSLENRNRKVGSLSLDIPYDPFTKSADIKNDQPLLGQLSINNLDIDTFASFIDTAQYGTVTGEINAAGILTGTVDSPSVEAGIWVSNLTSSTMNIDSLSLTVDYLPENKRMLLTGEINSIDRKMAALSGFIPVIFDFTTPTITSISEDRNIRLEVNTDDLDLALLNVFVDPLKVRQLTGPLDAKLVISGILNEPNYEGFANITNGKVSLIQQNIALREINLDALIENNRLIVRNLSAKSISGSAKVTADIAFKKGIVDDILIQAKMNKFRVMNKRDLKFTLSSDLKATGRIEALALSGKISADNGDIYLSNFGDKQVEEVILDEEKEAGSAYLVRIWRGLTADIKAQIENNVWVRNREYPELVVELNGNLNLIKTRSKEPELFGSVKTKRGYAKQFSKRFELKRGEFIFSGDPENPAINIETLYKLRKPDELDIYYLIGGTVKDPKFTFKSKPEMEPEDIVSYTLFGRPFAALMGWQQGITGNSTGGGKVSDVAVGILLDRVESYATEKIGLDVIEIATSPGTSNSGTSIKAGKYINDRTFLAIVQSLGGSEKVNQVVIEYLLRENLELILTQSSDESSGLDIRWRYEY